MTGVTVRVPGTTANLGSGFDFLGMAVERWLQIRARCVDDRSAPAVVIERHGALSDLGAPPEQDLIYRGFAAACRAAVNSHELADPIAPANLGLRCLAGKLQILRRQAN